MIALAVLVQLSRSEPMTFSKAILATPSDTPSPSPCVGRTTSMMRV